MKVTFILAMLTVSYGLAAGNILWDMVKGVSEGMEDAFKEGQAGKLKDLKEKLQKRIAEHPKLKHQKVDLKKIIKKAGKHIDKLHKKFIKKYGKEGAKLAKEKYNEAINKWMSTLTKNDTDGNEKHGIPFLPHVDLHKDDTWGERRREKAEKIFKNLAMMWETKINGKSDDLLPKKKKQDSYEKEENKKKEESVPKEQLFGKDEKNIMPDFVKEEFEKQRDLLGKDEKFIQPKFVSEELKNLHKIDLLGKDEKDISPKYLEDVKGLQKKEILAFKKELKRKPKLIGAEEYGVDLLGQTNEEKEKAVGKKEKLASVINKESEDLEKTVEELLPFLGKEKEERQQKVELKEIKAPKHVLLTSAVGKKFGNGLKMLNENPVVSKTSEEVKGEEDTSSSDEEEEEMMGTKERLLKSEKEKVEEVEKEFAEEQKLFAEAEKKWESEIQKIVMQEIEKKKKQKTAEKEEVEEELKEPYETVFTPPDEVTATVEPETKKKGEFNPLLDFKFEDSEDDKKFPKAEKVLPVPKRVQEPAEIFNHQKEPESEYEEMRPEIQPFFQRLDDVNFRSKFLEEEEQWMKLKQWAAKKLFKPGKKKDGQIY